MFNPWHLITVFFAAAIAFAISITYVLVLDADGSATAGQTAQWVFPPDRMDCNEIYGTAYRSENERQWFNQNCSAWSQSVGDVPDPVTPPPALAAPSAAAAVGQAGASWVSPAGRACDQVRGTAYRSDAERSWFLANCPAATGSLAAAQTGLPPGQAGPDRADCNQIRGTPYRSDNERNWYNANCQGATAQAPAAASGPDRTDCNQIRGTAYRSDSERLWFQANCGPR